MGGRSKADKTMAGTETGKAQQVTLSARVLANYATLAGWKGLSVPLQLRIILEAHHDSPEFQALLAQAQADIEAAKAKRKE
jgi:hypothetical protein